MNQRFYERLNAIRPIASFFLGVIAALMLRNTSPQKIVYDLLFSGICLPVIPFTFFLITQFDSDPGSMTAKDALSFGEYWLKTALSLLAISLILRFGYPFWPFWTLLFVCLITIIAAFITKKYLKIPLSHWQIRVFTQDLSEIYGILFIAFVTIGLLQILPNHTTTLMIFDIAFQIILGAMLIIFLYVIYLSIKRNYDFWLQKRSDAYITFQHYSLIWEKGNDAVSLNLPLTGGTISIAPLMTNNYQIMTWFDVDNLPRKDYELSLLALEGHLPDGDKPVSVTYLLENPVGSIVITLIDYRTHNESFVYVHCNVSVARRLPELNQEKA